MLRCKDEEGIALITTIMAGLALMAILAATMAYALGSLPLSRRDQDWNAALEAAQSGVDDYLYHLNQNGTYWQYSASKPPPGGNPAFSSWVAVPGPQDPIAANRSYFRYSVDASTVKIDGTVKVIASGKVRKVVRSVYVTLRRRNFLDYLYFTDYETKDPAAYNNGSPDFDAYTPAQAGTLCNRHYWDSPPRDNQCTDIYWVDADEINGPMHSNDALLICGDPEFNGETSTSWDDPAKKRYRTGCGGTTPDFAFAGDPRLASKLDVPPSNSAIKSETDPSVGGTGCLFTGPTRIVLNSNGTMNVTSPFTKSSNCARGNGVALPANGVIYVQNVPAVPTDPNYTAGCPVGSGNPIGYPIALDITQYQCRTGDAFVSGTLKGQLTIAAENNIVVVWHTLYQGGVAGTDLLGLVANNYIEVYHPVRCTTFDAQGRCTQGANLDADPTNGGTQYFNNAKINAAILSVQHSFRVQNYRLGTELDDLDVTGVIAQRYRGIVGTFSGGGVESGYAKDYVYDTRMKYLSPPHFLDPVKSAWHVATWAEVKAAATP